jgi:diaminopimelate decarboxylase
LKYKSLARDTGLPVEEQIAAHFGTPVFVYDADTIAQNYHRLRTAVHQQADVFYSLKANPNVSVAGYLKQLGAGAEVSSLTELETAVQAGFDPRNIIFVGPVKTNADIVRAIELRILALVVDSFEELERIQEIGCAMKLAVPVIIRINPDFTIEGAPIKMSGVASQFGFTESDVFQTSQRFRHDSIHLLGIHVYNGSRVLDEVALAKNIEQIIGLAERAAKALDMSLRVLDIGGGWGVPYFDKERDLDILRLAELLRPVFTSFHSRHTGCRLITESGRYLVASAGTLLSRVYAVKVSHGQRFVVTDAGYNCFMAAAGFGSFVQRNFPVSLVGTPQSPQPEPVNIAGPLCTPGDLIARKASMAPVVPGSLVAIGQAGAYGPSASPIAFIGHGHPAEVLVDGDSAYLIRDRDRTDDLLRRQHNLYALSATSSLTAELQTQG